jgi:hypothetical protein
MRIWLETQNRVQWRAFVNTVMNFQVAINEGNLLNDCVTIKFPIKALYRRSLNSLDIFINSHKGHKIKA